MMINRFLISSILITPSLLVAAELSIPARPADSVTGSEFAAIVSDMDLDLREAHVYNEIAKGNMPVFLRDMVPVTVQENGRTIVYEVSPDVLAIGSNDDYLLMPMGAYLAQWIVDLLDAGLPTTKMSDQIHNAAAIKLQPSFIPPSPAMTTVPVFVDHNTTVGNQRTSILNQFPLGTLVAGHKKDVVTTTRLATRPGSVAIYGWHYPDGDNVQPLYLGHADFYSDYSHGIRAVNESVLLDGQPTNLFDVLNDSNLAPIISSEGRLASPRYNAGDPPAIMPFADGFDGSSNLDWRDRFTTNPSRTFSGGTPDGDNTVMVVSDLRGGIDSASTGYLTDGDYKAEAVLYCDYRPAVSGYDRIGLFSRDDGGGLFEGASLSGAVSNNYSLTWDSDTGMVHCFRVVDGVPTDILTEPLTLASTAWRTFSIEALDDQLRFSIDGQVILEVEDSTHRRGAAGIGYHDFFPDNSNIEGTITDSFTMERIVDVDTLWILN